MLSYHLQANNGSFYLYCGKRFLNVNGWRFQEQSYVYESKTRNSRRLGKQRTRKSQQQMPNHFVSLEICRADFFAENISMDFHDVDCELQIPWPCPCNRIRRHLYPLQSCEHLFRALNAVGPSTCQVLDLNGAASHSGLVCS